MRQTATYLRLLLWLKSRLLWRMYTRQMSAALGVVLLGIVFVPMSLLMAAGATFGFRALPPPYNEHLLRGVLLWIYLMWLLSPIFGYVLTEEYDPSKLFLYPVPPRVILAGVVAGSVLDFGVLMLGPMMLAVVIGFGRSIAAVLLALAAVGLFLFHTLALGQAVNLGTAGLLRTRRARDLMVVLVPLISVVLYVLMQMISHRAMRVNWRGLLQGQTWNILSFLPPGLAARAVGAASGGEYYSALGFLTILALVAAATLYLATWVLELVYAGEVTSGAMRKRPTAKVGAVGTMRVREALAPASAPGWFGRLPPVVQAVADKEFKYLVRDPYFRASLVSVAYILVMVVFMFLQPWGKEFHWGTGTAGYLVWGVGTFFLIMQSHLPLNIFGTEGNAASLLFLFPGDRKHILMGKNLALFAALSAVNAGLAVLLTALARQLHLLPLVLLWMELATVMFIAGGNLVSVYLPYRVVMRGWRIQRGSASTSFLYGLAHMATSLAIALVALPVLGAILVPTYWAPPIWLVLTLPVAAAYTAFAYLLSLHLAEQAVQRREPEIAERLAREE
jgi:ABC-2 type transport system permease protein